MITKKYNLRAHKHTHRVTGEEEEITRLNPARRNIKSYQHKSCATTIHTSVKKKTQNHTKKPLHSIVH